MIPRGKAKGTLKCEVRMMLPFTIQCIKCGEYMYRGKKYTARTEWMETENYLGIKKVRRVARAGVWLAIMAESRGLWLAVAYFLDKKVTAWRGRALT